MTSVSLALCIFSIGFLVVVVVVAIIVVDVVVGGALVILVIGVVLVEMGGGSAPQCFQCTWGVIFPVSRMSVVANTAASAALCLFDPERQLPWHLVGVLRGTHGVIRSSLAAGAIGGAWSADARERNPAAPRSAACRGGSAAGQWEACPRACRGVGGSSARIRDFIARGIGVG